MSKHLVVEKYFNEGINYDRTPNGCWEWKGHINEKGYGRVRIGSTKSNKLWYAHRLSYQTFKGDLLAGKQINHTCDNTLCVNPEHLYQGTPKDNMDDMFNRGRNYHPAGSSHKQAKLTEEDVTLIRTARHKGVPAKAIWQQHFPYMAYSTIRNISNNIGWKHVKI